MSVIPYEKTGQFDYGEQRADGQYQNYPVLPDEKRKDFVRPVRRSYKHTTCGCVTGMGQELAETYAANPSYYSHTFCVECRQHRPVAEFTWVDDGSPVGS